VPAPLLTASLTAAIHVAARHAESTAGISLSVAALMEGVLQAMFGTQVKIAATVLLVVAVLGTGAGVVTYPKLAAQQPGQKKAQEEVIAVEEPSEVNIVKKANAFLKDVLLADDAVKALLATSKESDKLKALLKDRYDEASLELAGRFAYFMTGRGTLFILLDSSRRLFDAERELSDQKTHQIAAAEKHLRLLKEVEKANKERFEAGRVSVQDYAQSKYYRLEAEIWLERAKAK
jgi:hypothetical protein